MEENLLRHFDEDFIKKLFCREVDNYFYAVSLSIKYNISPELAYDRVMKGYNITAQKCYSELKPIVRYCLYLFTKDKIFDENYKLDRNELYELAKKEKLI